MNAAKYWGYSNNSDKSNMTKTKIKTQIKTQDC